MDIWKKETSIIMLLMDIQSFHPSTLQINLNKVAKAKIQSRRGLKWPGAGATVGGIPCMACCSCQT